jgi:hypothetical protein
LLAPSFCLAAFSASLAACLAAFSDSFAACLAALSPSYLFRCSEFENGSATVAAFASLVACLILLFFGS